MSDVCKIDITYDGVSEIIYAEKLTDVFYKCLESSLFIDFITYGCEIEVEEEDGKLKFFSLYKESPYKTYKHIWSKELIESNQCKRMKDRIVELGGEWEVLMGGVFFFHLPEEQNNQLSNLYKILEEVD